MRAGRELCDRCGELDYGGYSGAAFDLAERALKQEVYPPHHHTAAAWQARPDRCRDGRSTTAGREGRPEQTDAGTAYVRTSLCVVVEGELPRVWPQSNRVDFRLALVADVGFDQVGSEYVALEEE